MWESLDNTVGFEKCLSPIMHRNAFFFCSFPTNHTTPIQIYFEFVHFVASALSLRYLMLVPGQLFTGPVNLGRPDFKANFGRIPICKVSTSLLLSLAMFIRRFAMSLV